MFTLIGWTLGLYAGIKFAHLISGAGRGFDRSEAGWSARIRAGEPGLSIGALAVFAILAAYVTWWNQRFLEGHYTYAADCYSRMSASHLVPGRPAKFGSYEASKMTRWYVKSAGIHGAQLGMRAEVIDRNLERGRGAYSAYFTRLASGNEPGKVAASLDGLDRCLNGDGSPKGELLRPA